ncbi:hypothetical protein [Pelomonas cellulosilytica]|uniref:Fimbrial assembly protein n=1 Tax=Pelomonas cellulosilytica TaxID=2906762 RepID=A0ABS8XUH3_9BURK|nr:hypothetical protein [Pelomonas sp. P8]MCE4554271.1 hypothetical protein [Pelomonas sp. P8]
MSRAEPRRPAASLVLVVQAHQVTFGVRDVRSGGWAQLGGEPMPPAGLPRLVNLGTALAAVAQRLREGGAAVGEVRAVVSDTWLATVAIPWAHELLQTRQAFAYATQLMDEAGFEDAAGDAMRIDDAPYGLPRIAVSYPRALLAALDACAQAMSCRVTSVLPLSQALWRAGRGGRPVALRTDDEVILVTGTTRLEAVTTRMRPDDRPLDRTDLDRLWARQMLRAPLEAGTKPRLLDLGPAGHVVPVLSGSWEPLLLVRDGVEAPVLLDVTVQAQRQRGDALDAVPASLRPGGAAVAVLATLAAFAMVLAWSAWQSQQEAMQLARQAEQRSRPPAPRPAPRTLDKEKLLRQQAIDAAAQQLDAPFHALLKALQPARDIQVAVLGVDFTAAGGNGSGRMVLMAEAASALDMTRYVSFIDGRRPLGEAYMTHHEQVPVAGGTGYRFTLEVAWSK